MRVRHGAPTLTQGNKATRADEARFVARLQRQGKTREEISEALFMRRLDAVERQL